VSPLGGDVEPALLSLCCYQLNRKRKPPAKIDAELLRTVGQSILADFYQEAVKDMPPRVSRFIEENLILGDRYRNPYPREVALASGDLTEDELNHLTKNRLLRNDPQGDELRIELIHDRLVGVVRESRDARRASEAQEAERAATEKQQRDALEKIERERAAAEQRVQLERERERATHTEHERARVARWRNGLMVAAAAMALMIGGLVVQSNRARKANTRLAAAAETLNDTAKALNANLDAAKEDFEDAKKDLETTKVELAQARLELAKADQARDTNAQAAAARLRAAEAQLQAQDEKARATEASRQALGRQPTLTVSGWRLASGGCDKGAVSVKGEAEFTVVPRGNQVEVHEAFSGSGNGFTVKIDSKVALPAKHPGCYDLTTTGEWNGPGRSFKTQGVDRVCVNAEGAPVSATIMRIRTDCGS
jgi:predicted  nucleic acid-binding Zn-ribbon protein